MKPICSLLLTMLLAVAGAPGMAMACNTAADCDDKNTCTTDTCDLVDGCIHTPTPACTPRIDVPIALQKLKLRIPSRAPDKKGIGFSHRFGGINMSNLPLPGSAGDPTISGGSLRVYSATGGFDKTYPLPPWQWLYRSIWDPANPQIFQGYWYKDALNKDGPVGLVIIRAGQSARILVHGPGTDFALAANPNPVNVVLTVGDHRYCMAAGGYTRWLPDKSYLAIRVPAPTACPCKIDADCDDGDAGDGAEVCTAGFCQ